MERINCLWTGGLDSTYTVAYFSRFEVEIQPYYILDKHRDSQKYELKAISEISNIIRMHKDTKAKLLPIITAKVEDIAEMAKSRVPISFAF
jgi:7-cyano-7-deazaguanine synthase